METLELPVGLFRPRAQLGSFFRLSIPGKNQKKSPRLRTERKDALLIPDEEINHAIAIIP